jgi:hypothetical protein
MFHNRNQRIERLNAARWANDPSSPPPEHTVHVSDLELFQQMGIHVQTEGNA